MLLLPDKPPLPATGISRMGKGGRGRLSAVASWYTAAIWVTVCLTGTLDICIVCTPRNCDLLESRERMPKSMNLRRRESESEQCKGYLVISASDTLSDFLHQPEQQLWVGLTIAHWKTFLWRTPISQQDCLNQKCFGDTSQPVTLGQKNFSSRLDIFVTLLNFRALHGPNQCVSSAETTLLLSCSALLPSSEVSSEQIHLLVYPSTLFFSSVAWMIYLML